MILVTATLEDARLIEPRRREDEGRIIVEPDRHDPNFAQARQR